MRNKKLFFLIILVAFSQNILAQIYPFRSYSIEDGLSESVVYDIIQDNSGYIWLGTGFGLNKFDGVRFESFFEESGLNSNKIQSLYEDSRGRIWIGTTQGVNYIENDSIYHVDELSPLESNSVISIYEDKSGIMWFGTDGGGAWQYGQNTPLILYSTSQGLKSSEIHSIIETENRTMWFGTANGLSSLKDGNLRNYSMEDGLPSNRILDLKIDSKDNLWIATRSGLSKFDNKSFVNYGKNHNLKSEIVQTLEIDEEDKIWVGTESGAAVLENGEFKNFTTESGLSNNIIYSSFIDQEQNIWFGTFGGGANLFLGDYFQNFKSMHGLRNDVITSFTQDKDGTIWVATYGGGMHKFVNENRFEATQSPAGLDNKIYYLFTDSENRIWIGTHEGLAIKENGRIKIFSDREFPYKKVRHIFESSNGEFWISTYDEGVIKYDGKNFEQISTQNGLIDNTVLRTVEGDDNSIWIATYGGVTRYFEGEMQSYSIQEGLPNNAVMTIINDKSGRIWVSTFGGIAWYDGLKFQSITEEDGLPYRVAYFIEQGENEEFWIGTNGGIVRFEADKYFSDDPNIKDQAFQNITQEQGLIADELNLGAVFEDDKNRLWFGSVEGISLFSPENYKGNPVSPSVRIDHVIASGRTIERRNSIKLNHNQNVVEIHFSGINFTAPNQILYEYRVIGIDPEWQRTTQRIARYPSLPSGEYTFEIHARNTNGEWSDEFTIISFVISSPFWMTWWFLSLVFLLVIGIIWLFYNYYKVSKMVDIERMRVRIASDLHDDVGASLTEIALQSDFLQASVGNSEYQNSLNQIGKQCRKIVSSLDDIVWSIDARNDTVGDLTDRMQDYILNVLEQKNMSVKYNFDDLKMNNKLDVVFKENIYLIFKEAVNNIAKYSDGDEVEINLKNNSQEFELTIHDNGSSQTGEKKTGHGLRNILMRAERIGATAQFLNKNGFTVYLKGKLNSI